MLHFWIACLLTLFCARAHVRMYVCAQKNIFGNMICLSVCMSELFTIICMSVHMLVSVMRTITCAYSTCALELITVVIYLIMQTSCTEQYSNTEIH